MKKHKKKRWQDILLDILNWFDPPNRMTIDEQISYRKELEAKPPYEILKIASYEPPSPTTDGKIAAEGMRRRAMSHEFQEHPGHLRDMYQAMLKEKTITRRLDETFEQRTDPTITEVLQKMPKMPKKHTLLIHSEPLQGDTPYETPAFLKDRKVG